jgi:hypothetical protein
MKLEALKSAARQTVAVINAARALPEGDRRELDLALKRADSLVAKAAQVVRESSDRDAVEAAEAEAELQKLKATIAAAKVVGTEEPSQASADEDEDEKDEDGRFDPVHSKSEVHFGGSSEVQVAMDEGAHAEHETTGDAPVDEETEKAKAEFLEALDGTATSDEEEPSAPR